MYHTPPVARAANDFFVGSLRLRPCRSRT